jgi:hypothetical protein
MARPRAAWPEEVEKRFLECEARGLTASAIARELAVFGAEGTSKATINRRVHELRGPVHLAVCPTCGARARRPKGDA